MDSQKTPERDPDVMPPPRAATPPPDETIDDAQLSLRAWLTRNGTTLVLVAVGLVLLYKWGGLEGMWTIAKVALGLSAVIFIHELGHFLVAKWCDVHVQTFSIGFGPALPGCSYKWGETTYKLALFPLGGYVKMVGEGGENDEEDTDPRSYKNKTVGQRMAIISAGVVMNVLFAVVVFIAAFKIGVHQTAPGVAVIEAGGPAWVKGMRTGSVFKKVGDISNPSFDDVRAEIMLSGEGEHIPFVLEAPDGEERTVSIEPRKTKDEPNPVIGVRWPMELALPDKPRGGPAEGPAMQGSAAAVARRLDLGPDDELLAATDPDHPDSKELKPLAEGHRAADLAGRFRQLADKPITLSYRAGGAVKELVLEPGDGFDYGDKIVGTTDPAAAAEKSFSPFRTAELRWDPRDPQHRHRDYYQFLERMQRLAAYPIVIQVERKESSGAKAVVNLFVPPAYHQVIPGLHMDMGQVTALRERSSAALGGVQVHDTIIAITLTDNRDESVHFALNPDKEKGAQLLDPLRLTFDLRQWAAGRSGVKASLEVRREENGKNDAVKLPPLDWNDSWRFDEELPLGFSASMSIPELGIAYQVLSSVRSVDPGSYAHSNGLRAADFVVAWSYEDPPADGKPAKWSKPADLGPKDNPTGDADPNWASVFYAWQWRLSPGSSIKLWVKRPNEGKDEKVEIELQLQSDEKWPLADAGKPRGLPIAIPQDRIEAADSLGQAIQMGLRYTRRTIVQIYVSIRSLVTRRVSATENLQGPIDIAVYAYDTAGRDWADFFRLLGLISINLAVVNFLPIPILDGGHMVFLLYEKLRGRPASEYVRYASNVLGLLFLLSLMGFVLYLGFSRWIWPHIPH